MYLIDKDSDALYTVRQIQAPTPPPPLPMPEIGTEQVGIATQFGLTDVTVSAPRGLAFVGSTLYMVDDNTDALYTVDTTTGVASRVGSATRFGILDARGQAVTNVSPRGLAWDGTNLYMVTNDTLYTLGTDTGAVGEDELPLQTRPIVFKDTVSEVSGLAWDERDLYFVDRNSDRDARLMYKFLRGLRDELTGIVSPVIMQSEPSITPSGLASPGTDDDYQPIRAESVLYMGSVDPAGDLYRYNTLNRVATKVGSLGISTPTAFAWHAPSSTLYVVDDATDALYRVTDLLPSIPNAGDLYYNGSNFADAFMRWDNPKWIRDDKHGSPCASDVIQCSTYEHDLILDWSNDGGWFTVKRATQSVLGIGSTVWPGYLNAEGEIEAYGIRDLRDSAHFCTSWTDLPQGYDDCDTSGVAAEDGTVELSFWDVQGARDHSGTRLLWLLELQQSKGKYSNYKCQYKCQTAWS